MPQNDFDRLPLKSNQQKDNSSQKTEHTRPEDIIVPGIFTDEFSKEAGKTSAQVLFEYVRRFLLPKGGGPNNSQPKWTIGGPYSCLPITIFLVIAILTTFTVTYIIFSQKNLVSNSDLNLLSQHIQTLEANAVSTQTTIAREFTTREAELAATTISINATATSNVNNYLNSQTATQAALNSTENAEQFIRQQERATEVAADYATALAIASETPIMLFHGFESQPMILNSKNSYQGKAIFPVVSGGPQFVTLRIQTSENKRNFDMSLRVGGKPILSVRPIERQNDYYWAGIIPATSGMYDLIVSNNSINNITNNDISIRIEMTIDVITCIQVVKLRDGLAPFVRESPSNLSRSMNATGYPLTEDTTVSVVGFRQGWFEIHYPTGIRNSDGFETGWIHESSLVRDEENYPGCYFGNS